MDFETLEITQKGTITHVALNRPQVMNAMNKAFFTELHQAFLNISNDHSIRAVVLSGNGKNFSAGLDLKDSGNMIGEQKGDPARVREKFLRHIRFLQQSINVVDSCPVPVIAAVQGACVGAGVDLVSACDIRMAARDAWFAIQEVNVAIVADLGTLQRGSRILPHGLLRELAYTGRKFPAGEAKSHGFINGLMDDKDSLLDASFDLAEEIAAKSPVAVRGTKEVLNHARDHSIKDGLDYVAAWNSGMLLGEDLLKAASAALTGQSVQFADLYDDDEN